MIKTTYYQDLTKMNTFGMKVKARCFMEYDSVADLVDIDFAELARPVLHIGGGSNLLFTDDFKGTVLHSKINFIEVLDGGYGDGIEKLNPSHSDEWVPPVHEATGGHGFSNHPHNPQFTLHSEQPSLYHCDTPERHCDDCASICHFDRAQRVEKSSSPVLVSVGAGVVFDDFCEWAAKEGLWGVENLSYIPGEVGASAVQNIGAYGVEVKDVIHTVYCYDTAEEEFVSFPVEECGYGYRDSIFKNPEIKGRYIVTHVVFALSREPKLALGYGHLKDAVYAAACSAGSKGGEDRLSLSETPDCHFERSDSEVEKSLTPALIRKVIIGIRKEKLPEPSVMGSAGSFFKNPVISLEHFARIEAAAKAEHGPDYKVPHYIIESQSSVETAHGGCGSESSECHFERSVSEVEIIGEAAVANAKESVKIPAAWLIEQCGWKGRRSGGAAVYDKQPLVIVNYTGEAYPEEIIGLERRIIASVKDKFGVELHPEVEHI